MTTPYGVQVIVYPSGKGRDKMARRRMSARQKRLFDLLETGSFASC